jgi:hypothetical protein
MGWLESPKPCRWTGKRLHHGDDVCGLCLLVERVICVLFLVGILQRGFLEWVKIDKTSMTKDIKVVKNIKKSVQVFVILVPTAIYLCRNQYILCRA